MTWCPRLGGSATVVNRHDGTCASLPGGARCSRKVLHLPIPVRGTYQRGVGERQRPGGRAGWRASPPGPLSTMWRGGVGLAPLWSPRYAGGRAQHAAPLHKKSAPVSPHPGPLPVGEGAWIPAHAGMTNLGYFQGNGAGLGAGAEAEEVGIAEGEGEADALAGQLGQTALAGPAEGAGPIRWREGTLPINSARSGPAKPGMGCPASSSTSTNRAPPPSRG